MNATPSIDLSIPANVELLHADLIRAFPESARYLMTSKGYRQDGVTVSLAYAQHAYQDVTWGWQPIADIPQHTRSYQTEYRPCSLGGRFTCDRFNIGD